MGVSIKICYVMLSSWHLPEESEECDFKKKLHAKDVVLQSVYKT